MDHWIITRQEQVSSRFSDLHDYNMLDIPDDAGPQAQELLVKSRVGRHLNEMYNSYRKRWRMRQLSNVRSVRKSSSLRGERAADPRRGRVR